MERAVRQSRASQITLTGGEPLLHPNALTIIEKACSFASVVHLVTNGSHLRTETIQQLARFGLKTVQLTLLSAEPRRHNRLKGADSFEDTVRAVLDLKECNISVNICFVATHENSRDFAEVVELCFALGVSAIVYNRMSCAGGSVKHFQRLLPTVAEVESNLMTAERLGRKWNIQISTGMPIPPCLIRLERYKWIRFGFCSVGTSSMIPAIDPLGNVRWCNLASHILGNITEHSWNEIIEDTQLDAFTHKIPRLCRACNYRQICRGSCKQSAWAVFGELEYPDPFIQLALQSERPCPSGRLETPQLSKESRQSTGRNTL